MTLKTGRNAHMMLLEPRSLIYGMNSDGTEIYDGPRQVGIDPIKKAVNEGKIFIGWPHLNLPLPAAMQWPRQKIDAHIRKIRVREPRVGDVVGYFDWFLHLTPGEYIFVHAPGKKLIVGETLDGDVTPETKYLHGGDMRILHCRPVKWLYPAGIPCPNDLWQASHTPKTYGGNRSRLISDVNALLP